MDAIAPQSGDLVLDKIRHSFFAHTELDPVLWMSALMKSTDSGRSVPT